MVYWSVFLIAQVRYKKPSTSHLNNTNPVSIIVCAYNELDNLKGLIPNLLNQNHDNYEVIIVNDRSDDGSYDLLNSEKNKYQNLQVVNVDRVHDHINTKKYAITLGVKAAKNDLLLFTDADCKPNSADWINEMSACVDNSTTFVLGYSPYEKQKGFLNAFIRFETRITGIIYTAFAMLGNPYMGVGRNLLYRKSFFMEKNGFNKFQNITGGDDDLFVNQFAVRSNTKVIVGEKSMALSIPKKSWGDFFMQKKRHVSVGKYYKFKDRLLLGLYSISYALFWLMGLTLLIFNIFPLLISGIVFFRLFIVIGVVIITSKKFGYQMNIWTIPAFDFIYSFYIIIAGTIAAFTKKVTWR